MSFDGAYVQTIRRCLAKPERGKKVFVPASHVMLSLGETSDGLLPVLYKSRRFLINVEHVERIGPDEARHASDDPVDHPRHYNQHPSGVEAIVICEHLNFCLGNAVKYILRADHKGSKIEDIQKARWYIDRELIRLQKEEKKT
jgi:hypothetical protein